MSNRNSTEIAQWASRNPKLQTLAVRYGIPLQRAVGLYVAAGEIMGEDAYRQLQLAEQSLHITGGDPTRAMRHINSSSFDRARKTIDGTVVKITLPVHLDSRQLSRDDFRERTERFVLDPQCRILWNHQEGSPWQRDKAAVGSVLAARPRPVTNDLEVWAKLTRGDVIEAALFGEVSASPGVSYRASDTVTDGYNRDGDPVRLWHTAVIRELSLCPRGSETMADVTVDLVSGAPADLAAAWAMTTTAPPPAPHHPTAADQVRTVTTGPADQVYTRHFPGAGLHVR